MVFNSHDSNQSLSLMRISELSKRTGFTKSTIHHYVKIGLLPAPSRVRSNLYLYDEAHVRGLERIESLKITEKLSLEQVKEALEKDPLMIEGELVLPSTTSRKTREQSETQVAPNMHEMKRIQIIDNAIMLFSKLGYDAVKISDITDAVQMGKGTFYLYFKNKKELMLACFDRLFLLIAPLELRSEIRDEKDFSIKMKHRWLGFNENFDTFRGVLSLIRTACRSDEKDVKDIAAKAYYAWIDPIKRDIEQNIIKGITRPIDAELATFFILGMSESFSFRLTLDQRYSVEDTVELYCSIIKDVVKANGTDKGTKETGPGCRTRITDRNGVKIELANTRFSGASYLTGKLGESEIQVDPSKLSDLSVRLVGSKSYAFLTAKDGQQMSLEVDGSVIITGDTPFGSLDIPIGRVSRVTISHGNSPNPCWDARNQIPGADGQEQ